MNSSESSPAPANRPSGVIKLVVKGLGHVPALKNSMFSIVQKENREWKKRCVHSFVSQLLSTLPTGESATLTLRSLHCLIASLPPDDNWQILTEITIRCQKVQPGDEGAEIEISEL